MFKAHRLLYHSTLGLRVIKKEKKYASTYQVGRHVDDALAALRVKRRDHVPHRHLAQRRLRLKPEK